VFERGYGLANIEHDLALTSRTVFDIGSTSKQFTAAAIFLLEQQGKLSVNDDVRKAVPELPSYGETITIRHLLNHTSGIRDYLTLMSVAGVNFDGVTTDEDALKLIVRQKALNFTPGSEHLYSNSGYFLLSVIVKRASGKSLRAFAEEHIFRPLEMRDTHFHDDHTMPVPRRATGYAPGPEGTFRIDMSGFEQTGDGAVYTTIEDLAKWDRNFYEPKVGGKALVDALLRNGVLTDGRTLPYAAGLVHGKYKGLETVSHGGSWAGYRADLVRFPDQRLSVICLCNRADGNPGAKARQVAEVFLATEIAPEQRGSEPSPPPARAKPPASSAPALTPAELSQLAGTYYSEELDITGQLSVDSGKLAYTGPGTTVRTLEPLGGDRFGAGPWQLELTRDSAGNVTGFLLHAGRIRGLRFTKR
jgi:CubicO group peptidase (beta-lactamase class C family)